MWIDSHCHLNHERNESKPAGILKRAKEAGIAGAVNINCRISDEFPVILETARQFDNLWCTVGTHPHDSGLEAEKAISLEKLVTLAKSDPKIIGIGESGLDYHYMNSPEADQKESFRKHILACIESGLPLVVHARDADKDIIEIIKEEGAGTGLTGVMHCFSSGLKLAEAALEFGFYISFSGIVTFKKSKELQDIARNVPLSRTLVETDAPFLAPEPLRGKVNEPAYLIHTGKFLAGLHNISEEELAKRTTENFFKLFSKAWQSWVKP